MLDLILPDKRPPKQPLRIAKRRWLSLKSSPESGSCHIISQGETWIEGSTHGGQHVCLPSVQSSRLEDERHPHACCVHICMLSLHMYIIYIYVYIYIYVHFCVDRYMATPANR
jgi:hypothetical protein